MGGCGAPPVSEPGNCLGCGAALIRAKFEYDNVKGGRGKGGPAVDNAINAHVDDKINHLIQIATEFKIRNDQRRKAGAPLLSYPTLRTVVPGRLSCLSPVH